MKIEIMIFKNIKDILSRDEMKKVMAGSGGNVCGRCDTGRGVEACTTGNGGCWCYVVQGPARICF